MVAIAATARWRARIVAAAASAGITLTDPLAGVPGIRVLACTPGDLGVIVPKLGGEPSRAAIGAHSDSIADRELRDAVADVGGAAFPARQRGARPRRGRPPSPGAPAGRGRLGRCGPSPVDGAGGDAPGGHGPARGPLTVALTAGPGFEGTLLELARLVEADAAQPVCRGRS